MPYETHFYECIDCGRQYDNYGAAEECEGTHAFLEDEY